MGVKFLEQLLHGGYETHFDYSHRNMFHGFLTQNACSSELTNLVFGCKRRKRGDIVMKKSHFTLSALSVTIVMVLLLGIAVQEGQSQPPPVGAPVVREGAFAMKLAEALNMGQPSSETEAESMLGGAGIAPRNGWMADYPVTPDIIGELRDSVVYAVQAKTISVDQDAALKTLEDVQTGMNISVNPGPAGPPEVSSEGTTESSYPDQTVINDYYSNEGPPIVTYYAPPPDYYYLYGWVPYPFWWGGFWFGGFFILNDFHRHFRDHDHGFFVSNHFNDVRANRVFRVDPVNRYRGRTFAGIGAPRANTFINTGVQRAPERIFNRDRSFGPRSGTNTLRSQSAATGVVRQPSTSTRRAANPFAASRVYSSPPGGRTFAPRAGAPSGSRTFTAPAGRAGGSGGRQSSQPAGRGRTNRTTR